MQKTSLSEIGEALAPYGLIARGGRNSGQGEPPSMVLVGSAGSAFWPIFRASGEFRDGADHPMDRWSKRIGDKLAREFDGSAVYPFEGPPYHPFQQWSLDCEPVQYSRLGMLMHAEFGLWHAYRFALLLPFALQDLPAIPETASICDACELKPCLATCPVNAFTSDGYDVESCYHYLEENPDSQCNLTGCIARQACPQAESYQYEKEHAGFHMLAFKRSQSGRFGGSKR